MTRLMQNEKGQSTLEAVLYLALFFGVTAMVSSTLRDQGFLASVVEKPWDYVAGMAENGVWMPAESGRIVHPNHLSRHATPLREP